MATTKTKLSKRPTTSHIKGMYAVGSNVQEVEGVATDVTNKHSLTPFADTTAEVVSKGSSPAYASPIIITSGLRDFTNVKFTLSSDDADSTTTTTPLDTTNRTVTVTSSDGLYTKSLTTDVNSEVVFKLKNDTLYTVTTEPISGYVQPRSLSIRGKHLEQYDAEQYKFVYHKQSASDTALTVQATVIGEGKQIGDLNNAETFAYCPLNEELQSNKFNNGGITSYTLNQGKEYELGFAHVSGYVRPDNVIVSADAATKTVAPQYTSTGAFVFLLEVPEGTSTAANNFTISVTAQSGQTAIVHWGDGSADSTGGSTNYSHIYQPGKYLLSVEKASSASVFNLTGNTFVTELKNVNTSVLALGTFVRQCTSLTKVSGVEHCTSVAAQAFDACSNLVSVGGLTACTNLGANSFRDCSKLTTAKLTSICTTISDGVFLNCSVLSTIGTLTGIISIPTQAFYGCSSLVSVGDLTACTSVGNSAFSGCSKLTTAKLTTRCTLIAANAFTGCTALTTIGNLTAITSFGDESFQDCSSLTTVGDLTACTAIGSSAFKSCVKLTTAKLTTNCTSIGDSAFYGCTTITTLGNMSAVTCINQSVFQNCTYLTSVGDLTACTNVGASGFSGCIRLATAKLTSGCITLGSNAFNGCSALTTIGTLTGLTSIGENAFSGCTRLTTLALTHKTIAEVKAMDNFPWGFTKTNNRITCSDGYTTYNGSTWVDTYN